MGQPATLLFVYNADSGLANAALDTLHKIVSPSTYQCRLCEVSHGLFGMKKAWAATLAALEAPARFLHRDEFEAAYPGAAHRLPAILVERGGALEPLIPATDFDSITSLEALQALLAQRLGAAGLASRGGEDAHAAS
jgi:hypothetical protein